MPEKDYLDFEPCPNELEYQQLLDDMLLPERHDQVIKHLQRCFKCQQVCDSLINQLECTHRTTIVDSSPTLSQIHRIVGLVKQRMQADGSLPGNRRDAAPLDSTDLEELQREYPLVQELGRGGQGWVFLARDIALQRNVVIKLLSSQLQYSTESVERFKREARLLASVQNKHIVPIHRVATLPSGRLYMVMEYVDGKNLRQLIQANEVLSFQRIAMIILQVARGLSAAHAKRLVHRDIKPENILIQSPDSLARIVDFGLAVDVEDEARITVAGAVAGTPAYMSPEQVIDPGSVDFSTDLYSLGIVLYELLTGEVPFRGTARMTLIRLIHEDAITPRVYNDQIPRDLETICLRAISKDCTKRFRSAAHLAEELERFLDGLPIESRPVGWLEHAWRRVKRNPAVSALLGSIVFLVSVLAVVSTIYAVQLKSLNKQIAIHATIANQQRDAALSTLGDLTYQLQRKFDDPELYIEEIQQSSLEIALRGLEKMEGLAGQTTEGGLARAIALRRLGQTLSRLEKDEASIQCLDKSETLLRKLLRTEPYNQELVLAFADTTIARDECADGTDTKSQLARFAEAISLCQRAARPDRQADVKVSLLLYYQAKYQLRLGLLVAAGESLAKGRQLLSQHWDGTQLPNDTAVRNAILKTELCAIDLLRIEQIDHRDLANRLLKQVRTLSDAEQPDPVVLEAQLLLYESLGLLSIVNSHPAEDKSRQPVEDLTARLFSQTKSDMNEYLFYTEQIAVLAIDRLALGLDNAARDLLYLRVALAKIRLEQQSQDRMALLEQFDSHAALAGIELDVGTAASKGKSFEYCLLALKGFDSLAETASISADEWYSLVDIFDMLVEVCREDIAGDGQFCRNLRPWQQKIVGWMNDTELAGQADPEDLAACRELVQEIGELVKL